MCLMLPGKITEIKGNQATVDYGDEKREIKLPDKGYQTGDYVLVQGGIAIQKVPEQEAKQAIKTLNRVI